MNIGRFYFSQRRLNNMCDSLFYGIAAIYSFIKRKRENRQENSLTACFVVVDIFSYLCRRFSDKDFLK